MGMVIQDDFWEAAQAMPEKQRAAFLYAVVAYGMEGAEPSGRPPWLPTFLVIRQRIDLSNSKSAKGRKMAEARWGKQRARRASRADDAQAYAQAHAQHMQQHDESACTSTYTDDATACGSRNAESESEIGVGETPLNPPFAADDEDPFEAAERGGPPGFPLECLGGLNAALGTAYTTLPGRCARTLARFEGRYSPADVTAMVESKRDEWRGTRFARHLTPNTLFSPEHFEQYMEQSRTSAAEKRSYEQYDCGPND